MTSSEGVHDVLQSTKNNSSSSSLSGKLVCGTCGRTFMQLISKRVGEEGRRYWRCKSFQGYNGTEVSGTLFTERPQHVKPDDGSAAAHSSTIRRKPPVTRQMLCTDVEIPAAAPEQAFIDAWNKLVDGDFMTGASKTDNPLIRYRKSELTRLINDMGHIDKMSFGLKQQTLDCIKVHPDGSLEVLFLAGIQVRGG